MPNRDNLELFNRATHNSPIKIKTVEVNDKLIPEITFSNLNDTENLDVFEECLKVVLHSKIQWSKFESADDLLSVLKMLLIFFEMHTKQFIFRGQHNTQEIIEHMLRASRAPSYLRAP